MRIVSAGHAIFAATFIAIGMLGLITGHLAPIWEPVPRYVPAREALAYLFALISLVSGLGLLWRRAAAPAARALLAYLLVGFLLFKARDIYLAPLMEGSYEDCGETVVLIAGAGVLYAWLASQWDKQHLGFMTGYHGVRIARVLYALALIAFGLAHFIYLQQTVVLVPGWLPAHVAWAYLTGGTYIAAGAALLLGLYAPLAAALSALQMGAFTLLVWLPIVARGADASQWAEFVTSWALTAGGWVVADSYRARLLA